MEKCFNANAEEHPIIPNEKGQPLDLNIHLKVFAICPNRKLMHCQMAQTEVKFKYWPSLSFFLF